MKLLLDTHALVWYYFGDLRSSDAARLLIDNVTNTKHISPATVRQAF